MFNTPNSKIAMNTPEITSTPNTKVPNAPKKEKVVRNYHLNKIPKLLLPEENAIQSSSLGWVDTEESEEEFDWEEANRLQEARRRRDLIRWEMERRTGVREKYLQYDVEYVMQLDSIPELHQIKKWYEPSSQPRTVEEWAYVEEVREAAVERLKQLNCFCDICNSNHWDDMSTDDLLYYMK